MPASTPTRVAMLSMHTSPLAPLARTRDAGGMNVYVHELARELGRSGLAVDIFTRQIHPEIPLVQSIGERIRLIHIPAGPLELLPPTQLYPYVQTFTRRVAHFADQHQLTYDVIHSHYWLSAVAGMALARTWDTPHVTMYHTVELLKDQPDDGSAGERTWSAASRERIEQERRIAAAVDCITVSTAQEGEQLSRLYDLSSAQIRVIPGGVDLRAFTPGTQAERQSARHLLAPDGLPLLLFVGRLDPIKGIDLLLDSIAQMQTHARLVVVGGNPDGDPEVDRLRARADALGLGMRVLFTGAVTQRELPYFYRAADALVVASRYESFGLVAAEALACGTPVVASQVGGLPSIVHEGENGLLVRCRSARAFASRLDELLGDTALRQRLAANARPSVKHLGWDSIGYRVRKLYRELIAEHSPVAASVSC